MQLQRVLLLLWAGSALASPQAGGLGAGGTGGKGGLLGSLLGGKGADLPSMGIDPNADITTMVCQIFTPGNAFGASLEAMFGSPVGKGPEEQCMVDKSGGSGPYKANYFEDPSLPAHTIYMPTSPPKDLKMPVIVWGNGFCMAAGTMFANFLNEIASHGFFIIANGPAKGNQLAGKTTSKDLVKSFDWLQQSESAKKFNLDTSKLAVAGQSCGGGEAYGASTDPRVKLTVLFNSGNMGARNVAELKAPVAYFLGGPKDMAQRNGDADYAKLKVPALKASIDNGHIGSYYQKSGGKMGKAAVSFFKWQLKGDAASKAQFCSPATSEITQLGFKIESKNGMC